MLSYTGGGALTALKERLGARRVAPLYGSVDPTRYRPGEHAAGQPLAALSYLGTYAADRQDKLDTLLLEPARRRPDWRFVIGGAQYPQDFAWSEQHFLLAARRAGRTPALLRGGARDAERDATVDVRERVVPVGKAVRGGCVRRPDPQRPVGRDSRNSSRRTTKSWSCSRRRTYSRRSNRDDGELRRIGEAARARALSEHTAERRAAELVDLLANVATVIPRAKVGIALYLRWASPDLIRD